MRALFALLCLGAIFIGTRLTAWLVSIAYAPVLCPLELPPEALANKAREMAEKPGYSERLPGSIHGFDWNAPLADHLRALQEPLPPGRPRPRSGFHFLAPRESQRHPDEAGRNPEHFLDEARL